MTLSHYYLLTIGNSNFRNVLFKTETRRFKANDYSRYTKQYFEPIVNSIYLGKCSEDDIKDIIKKRNLSRDATSTFILDGQLYTRHSNPSNSCVGCDLRVDGSCKAINHGPYTPEICNRIIYKKAGTEIA